MLFKNLLYRFLRFSGYLCKDNILFIISSLTNEYPVYVIRYYRNNNKSRIWDIFMLYPI